MNSQSTLYRLKCMAFTFAFCVLSASCISCDTIPEESFINDMTPDEPYVVIELDNGEIYEGWNSQLHWWIDNDYEDLIEFGLRSDQGDILGFRLSYEGNLQPPDEISLEIKPGESVITTSFEGVQYSTFGTPRAGRVYDIQVDLDEKRFTAKFEAVLHPQMLEQGEQRYISGSISTHQWNFRCFSNSQSDPSFSSDFCKPFREYR